MTGFARIEGESPGFSWVWEVKSVNGKSLDLRLRLPSGVEAIEPQLRSALASRFKRGNLNATLTTDRKTISSLRINRTVLGQIIAVIKELEGEIEAAPPRLDGLLAMRGVIEAGEDADPAESERQTAQILLGWGELLDRLRQSRAEEGARLAAILATQLDEIETLVGDAVSAAAAQPGALRDRLLATLAELGAAVPPLPQERLAQEVVLLVARADIREEIDRLQAHIAQARDLLREGEGIGRRLDFLCQEFNREANTLCSKSSDIGLTRTGIRLKAAIEQLREQVQNIE